LIHIEEGFHPITATTKEPACKSTLGRSVVGLAKNANRLRSLRIHHFRIVLTRAILFARSGCVPNPATAVAAATRAVDESVKRGGSAFAGGAPLKPAIESELALAVSKADVTRHGVLLGGVHATVFALRDRDQYCKLVGVLGRRRVVGKGDLCDPNIVHLDKVLECLCDVSAGLFEGAGNRDANNLDHQRVPRKGPTDKQTLETMAVENQGRSTERGERDSRDGDFHKVSSAHAPRKVDFAPRVGDPFLL
jgi:hypothetical protein